MGNFVVALKLLLLVGKWTDPHAPNVHTMAPRLALIQIMLKVKVEGHDIGYQRSAISAIAALPVVLYLLTLSSLKFLIISSETFRCRRKAVSLSSSSILSTQ